MNPALHGVVAVVLVAAGTVPATPAAAVLAPGTVLTSATATLPAELAPLATGKRITYATTAGTGTAITATGLIMTPRGTRTGRTVVWGHGSTGLADRCAPSANPEVFWPEARTAVAALLGRGWTVAAPDYPGLGTPAAHPYLAGTSEARSMIDAVKAARRLDGSLGPQYAVDGHSQGGQGALFAGELAPAYDGPLELRGVAAIAPVSNAALFAPQIPGTAAQGYLVMALFGLQAVDGSVNATTLLAPPARRKIGVLTTSCLYPILDAYAGFSATQLLVGGALSDAVIAKLARSIDPAQNPPSADVLLVQGTADEAVPYELTAGPLLSELQAYDRTVTFVTEPGGTHDSTVISTAGRVADWIAARFGP